MDTKGNGVDIAWQGARVLFVSRVLFFFFCFAKIHLALLYFRFFRTFHDVNDAVMTGMVGARGLVTIR